MCDQPYGGLNTVASFQSFFLAKKNNIKVLFSGIGSDEIQYGYDYYDKKIKTHISSPIQGTNFSTKENLGNLFNWKDQRNLYSKNQIKEMMLQDLLA